MLIEAVVLYARDIDGVIEDVLNTVQRKTNEYIFYFIGWVGYGTTAFLGYMARVLPSMKDPPPGLRFGRIIYLDCSMWESKRTMQRKLAEELKLDRKTMAMFEEQDKEDDFYGVDRASRDVIRNVTVVIDQTLRGSRFMVIFINGSEDEIGLGPFGIPEYHDHVVIWTFRSSFGTPQAEKIRHTKIGLISAGRLSDLTSPQLGTLLHEEAAILTCSRDIDPTMAIDYFFYRSFLKKSRDITYQFIVREHTSSIWICDGVIQGDRAREISKALLLLPEIDDRYLQADRITSYLSEKTRTPYLIAQDANELLDACEKRPYRWIAIKLKNNITSKNKKKAQEDMQATLAGASSIILGSGCSDESPHVLLPNDLFKQCNNLCMLILSRCSLSFVSPPFSQCHTLRYLGLDHCTDDGTNSQLEGEDSRITKWACLYSLLVLDLYYTEWGEILSKEKIELMANLEELNIEGVWCWQWISQLEKRLPHLQRLRIIKPSVRQAQTSPTDIISNSLIDKTKLEVLDLSGNIEMENLPTSLSKASKLQELIVDGCVGLEDVVVANSSLKSFSFDCSKHVDDADKKYVKISKISLEGCTQLEKLILCGLPNLVELHLSGCPIKILDFATMVKDVPRLKRLFLLGCEHLRAIWNLGWFQGLLCIDTRPARLLGCTRPSSIAQLEGFGLQVHAIVTDARLVRSLSRQIYDHPPDGIYFNINITSSTTARSGAVRLEEATSKEMTDEESSDEQHHGAPAGGLYGDVLSKVGDSPIPMQDFPQPPIQHSDHHIEIGDGSQNVQSEAEAFHVVDRNLGGLLRQRTESLHVHDALARTIMPALVLVRLRWCRVERCPNLEAVFPLGAESSVLKTIWASDLLKARCIWNKGWRGRVSSNYFIRLQHLHLRSCPSLQYALPVGFASLPILETLHIIHCGALRHVFEQDEEEKQHHRSSVEFPKLVTIHLHDLPALQQICEAAEMLAPALETIRIRGCWSLRRLPAMKGREPGMSRPAVEVDKEVWDVLEWNGVDADHHPSLYATPVHARCYKKRGLLRGTVLR